MSDGEFKKRVTHRAINSDPKLLPVATELLDIIEEAKKEYPKWDSSAKEAYDFLVSKGLVKDNGYHIHQGVDYSAILNWAFHTRLEDWFQRWFGDKV